MHVLIPFLFLLYLLSQLPSEKDGESVGNFTLPFLSIEAKDDG